jgi:hypothetical protein
MTFSEAVRRLEQADTSTGYWEVPDTVGAQLDADVLSDELPGDMDALRAQSGELLVSTPRYTPLFSPEKLREWATSNDFSDALWHFPTSDYSIVNPGLAYSSVEAVVGSEGIGDTMFGEIREYKGGGEVHMDILFDAYQINRGEDDSPILLGVRSGYDYFGDTTLYFEGYAQDTACSNSIRAVTDKEVIRHTGSDISERINEVVEDVFSSLGLMTDRLAELIEMANDIEVDLLEMEFAEPMEHDDNLRALYELLDFPSYLASEAAAHARQRADDSFEPSMTALWDGATYALTHHYRGGEDTARSRQLIDAANDFIYNPSLVMDRAEQSYTERLGEAEEDEALEGVGASAVIADFTQSVQEQKDEFESRNEELRETLLTEAE